MIAHDPLHRSGRAELPHPAPTLGDDAQAHERIRMTNTSRWELSRNKAPHAAPWQVVTLAATAQLPSARDSPPLGEKRPAPGRSWAPRNSGSDPAGPSASTLFVPESACAGVAAALLSKPAGSLATSGQTGAAPNLLHQHLIGRFCLPARTFHRLAKSPRLTRNPKACSRTVAVLLYGSPNPYSVACRAPALVAPVGRPHRRSHSRFGVDAGLAPAAGNTGSAPPAPHLNAKLNPLDLWRRNLRLKLGNRLLPLQTTSTSRTPGGQRYLYYIVDLLRDRPTTASTILLAAFPSRFPGLSFGMVSREGGRLALTGPQRFFKQPSQPFILGFQLLILRPELRHL
jgi:hypothetical protein